MNSNRAVHGDTVVVELLPKSEWSCPARLLKIRDAEQAQNATDEPMEEDVDDG